MVIDTSAIVAILFQEPDARWYAEAIEADPTRLVSAASLFEMALVVEGRRSDPGGRDLDLLLHRAKATIVPFDADQAEVARAAWRRFAKGGHPAGLNMGDCFAYALAMTSGEPLLCKGDDFAKTDVARVELPPSL